jgi:hypothetical protein
MFGTVRRLLIAAVAVALVAPIGRAQERDVRETRLDIFYPKLDPKVQFDYLWKGQPGTNSAGVIRWEVPASEFGTNGFDRAFPAYCAEVLVPIRTDTMYRFEVNSVNAVKNYELAASKSPEKSSERRTKLIHELYGRYYQEPVSDANAAIAMQVALWEIIQETEPAEGSAKLDLFGGDFRANYPADAVPAYVTGAQKMLDSLTGNDNLFYENPAIRGKELVRLRGIENDEKVVAQAQLALRAVGGGAAGGSGIGRPLTGGSGLAALGGGIGGGNGGGSGGGGFFPGGGNNANTPPSNTPPATTPPTGGNPPGGGTPPGGGGGTPPGTTPPVDVDPPTTPPTNSVPAPAGLILGLLALGTVGSWRGARYLRKK